MFMERAAPATAEPAAKNAMEPSKISRRPYMFARPPDADMEADDATVYALPIQMKLGPLRSLTMVGRAVLTPVSSRALRKSETHVPTEYIEV